MAADAAPPIGRRAHASWLLFGGLFTGLAIAVCAVGSWVLLDGTSPLIERSDEVTYPQPTARIEVNIASGDLRVIGGASEVSVERHYRYRTQEPIFTESRSGDTLSLAASCDIDALAALRGTDCTVSYVLRVPSAVAVEAYVDLGGKIRVADIDGDLRLVTKSGDIEVRNVGGLLRVRSGGGAVTATGLRGAEADVRTQFGDVTLQFVASPGLAWATTSYGSVEIAVPHGDTAYHVRAQAAAGEAYVDVASSQDSPYQVIATTDQGDITVRYSHG